MAPQIHEIAAGVGHLAVSIANVYFVDGQEGRWLLIDAGVPGKADFIRQAAESRYGVGARPEAIVLTHGHYDHSGSAAELAEIWRVPILAHRLEMPYLSGKSEYPPPDPTAPGFMAFLSRFIKPHAIDVGDRLAPFDGEVPGMSGWEWFHTPGHAPGHVAIFRRSDRTLLAGDAFTTMNLDSLLAVATKQQRVCRPPTPVNYDWKAARESVRLLAELRPFTIACGHGLPMKGTEAALQLTALARNFPIPRHGRYVSEPARVDETGVVWLPPPAADPLPKVAGAIGAIGAAAVIVSVVKRRKAA
jgi:glyoxylase-like metal-dependent hydrolase (beta-lactamase superfamily II)